MSTDATGRLTNVRVANTRAAIGGYVKGSPVPDSVGGSGPYRSPPARKTWPPRRYTSRSMRYGGISVTPGTPKVSRNAATANASPAPICHARDLAALLTMSTRTPFLPSDPMQRAASSRGRRDGTRPTK